MEENKDSIPIDKPETTSPSVNAPAIDSAAPNAPPPDDHDAIGSNLRDFPDRDEKESGLAQRLAEAFREGVASTKPDYDRHPGVRMPPPEKKYRQKSDDEGMMDNIIRGGGTTVAIVGDKAASALDTFIQMVKKTPDLTQKYAAAFREGAASVRPRASRERREEGPSAAGEKESPPDGRALLDWVVQAGDSAVEMVRGAVSALKSAEARGAGHKICLYKKKIDALYTEIGREAVDSWGSGSIETEKISALLNELRKNEEEIQNLQEEIAKAAEARKAETSGRRQTAKETMSTPPSDKGDIIFAAGASDDKPNGQVYHLGDEPQQKKAEGVDSTVSWTSASEASAVEPPANPPAPGPVVEAEPAPKKEQVSDRADQVPTRKPDARPEKPKKRPPAKAKSLRGGIALSGRKRGRR